MIPAELLASYFQDAQRPGVVAAYLFGSHAAGKAHRESDIDVGVLLDREVFPSKAQRSEERLRLGSELIHVLGNNRVDLVVVNDAPVLLGRAIVRGERVFVSNPELERVFVRDVQLRAADLEPFMKRMRGIQLEVLRR